MHHDFAPAHPSLWRICINQSNEAVFLDLLTPDVVDHYAPPGLPPGRVGWNINRKLFRAAFPDLNFWGTADLIAEGEYVVGQWEGGGTHTGSAFSDLPLGSLPAGSGKKMRFTGTSVLRVRNGLITEELGIDDGVAVLKQLGLIPSA